MIGSRWGRVAVSVAVALALTPARRAAEAAGTVGVMPDGGDAFVKPRPLPINDRALAASIDRIIAAKWQAAGASPAPRSSDAEFLRRVSLDVAGRIPTASEARAFLDDNDPDKRRKVVERLLSGPAFATHLTNVWTELLIPEAAGSFQISFFAPDFEAWLRGRLAAGAPFDALVRDLITASPTEGSPFVARVGGQAAKATPIGFLAAKDGKPENLAASASRLFLGVRIECAQCHNHPFAKWKRDEFWGLAAFFSGLKRQGDGDSIFQGTDKPDSAEITIPGSKTVVKATFLDGRQALLPKGTKARKALADWMTADENPYFARATVNRFWSQFFGVGLVEPIDDLGPTAEASHPELLTLLADQFVAHDYDLKYLVRGVTASRAYQLTSAGGSPSGEAYRLFDRMPVRGLSPLQLYESLVRATGLAREAPPQAFVINNDSPRGDFLERFNAGDEKVTERQTSILQALTLMNGRLVTDATSLDRGASLPAVADAYFLDTKGKAEALFLATLSRRPTPEELERVVPYIDRGGPALDPKKALADVFWSLLGSAEFVFNH